MFNVGKTNAAMACPARPQANKADECRTLKNNTDSPNHQVFKMLSTWRVKTIHIGNTRILNYATLKKKKVLNHSTVLVLHPHLAVLHNPLLFNTINSCINTSFHLFSLMQRELDFFFNWVFFFSFYHLEKSCNRHYKSASVLTFCFPNSRNSCLAMQSQPVTLP